MTALQTIIKEAKAIRKKYPAKSWKDCVKQASAMYAAKHKGKSPVGKKRKVVKKSAPKKRAKKAIKKYTRFAGITTKSKTHTDYNKPEVNIQIGAVKRGSKFIYYKGQQIEKKPIIVTDGRRKKKATIYLYCGLPFHSLPELKRHINYLSK
jgi:hypothetical protein